MEARPIWDARRFSRNAFPYNIMGKNNTSKIPGAVGETAESASETQAPEPANVAILIKDNRTQIGKAVCAAGKCDFPVTESQAKQLVSLGKAEIIGIWA